MPKALFLLLPETISLSEDEMKTKEFSFSDLFELKIGLIEDQYSLECEQTGDEIRFVSIKSFSEKGLLLPEPQLEAFQVKTEKRKNLQNTSSKNLKKVSTEKFLQEEDFIIYTRGKPQGFSALKFFLEKRKNLVATHHFICLRPRLKIVDINVDYLHLMLNLFVTQKIGAEHERKLQENKSTAIIQNSLSITQLKNMKIALLTEKTAQKKVIETFLKKKAEFESIQFELSCLETFILENNFINSGK